MSASYPGSAKSFVSRNSGDVIQPAHVNDLQDEVNAIETGLLGGTAPISASNATLANLSVTGGSTLAGTVTMSAVSSTRFGSTGACSFAQNSTVWMSVTAQHIINSATQPRCVAYNNATQSIANNTITVVTLNSEDIDVGTMHDLVTNNSRITIPTGGDGLYLVSGKIYYAALLATDVRSRIFKNGAVVGAEQVLQASGSPLTCSNVQMLSLVATDYIELAAYQNSGGSINVGSATRFNSCDLSVVKVW